MIYYFSGEGKQEIKRRLNIDQLFSQYLERKAIINTIKYKHEHPEYTARIMVDSGAFTAYTKGVKIDVDDYIKFINEYGGDCEIFVAVDSIPDPKNVTNDCGEKTWENYLYMWERITPEYRHKLVPVFHEAEDFKWLENMLNYVHPDGSKVAYIGIALSLEANDKLRIEWGEKCVNIIKNSSNPDVKYHCFGIGVKRVLEHLNPTSTDATSWIKRAAFGSISIDDKPVGISDVKKELCKGSHYSERNKAYQEVVEETIKRRGFTIEELATSPYKRQEFNIIDTIEWVEKYNKEHENGYNKLKLKNKKLW